MKYNNLPEDFDWEFYLENHQDLIDAGLKTESDVIYHYLNHGKFENRVYIDNTKTKFIYQDSIDITIIGENESNQILEELCKINEINYNSIESISHTEKNFQFYLKKYFHSDQEIIFFDIGACDFSDSINVRRIFPLSQIFAIEASYENIQKYSQNAKNNNIHFDWYAVSDVIGTCSFYASKSYGNQTWDKSGSIIEPSLIPNTNESVYYKDLLFETEIQVNSITLDEYCKSKNVQKIDWLHIDIQGAEFKIFKSMNEIFPKYIWTEHCELSTYNTGITIDIFDEILKEKGYELLYRNENDSLFRFYDIKTF